MRVRLSHIRSIEYNLKRTVSEAVLHLKGRMIEVMEAKVEVGEEEFWEVQWSRMVYLQKEGAVELLLLLRVSFVICQVVKLVGGEVASSSPVLLVGVDFLAR